MAVTPYWRLSGFYLFYFASLGATIPYWSLYLKSEGFSSLAIGQLMALLMATKIVSPNLWGWLADHTGKRMQVVRIGSLLALLSFLWIFVAQGFWGMALVMIAFSFFWNAVLPQFEATTFTQLGKNTHRYSMIRLWGSVGFILMVAGLGPVLDITGPGLLPWVMVGLFIAILLSSLTVAEQPMAHHADDHEPILTVLRKPQVIALLSVCFLVQASHGPYYTFYTIYMEGFGYSRASIGQFWALGVVAEVVIFLIMSQMVCRFGLRRLLFWATALTALRWLLTGLMPESLGVMLFSQTLHAASFGIFHAVAIALIHQFFVGRNQGRGQALYSSLAFGAGGAFGALYSGILWDSVGPMSAYLSASAMALLAMLISWRWLRQG